MIEKNDIVKYKNSIANHFPAIKKNKNRFKVIRVFQRWNNKKKKFDQFFELENGAINTPRSFVCLIRKAPKAKAKAPEKKTEGLKIKLVKNPFLEEWLKDKKDYYKWE